MKILFITLFLIIQLFSNQKEHTNIYLLKNELKKSNNLLKRYYKNHDYKNFFIDEFGIKPISYSLISLVKKDPVLKPYIEKIFNINKIENLINKENLSKNELISLDFELVILYHNYMNYLSKGFIDWDSFQEELKLIYEEKEIELAWQKYNVRKNIRKLLYKAVEEDDISVAINSVNYTFPKVNNLEKELERYEEIEKSGGFVKVLSDKKILKLGDYFPEIKDLKMRLIQSQELDNLDCVSTQELQDYNCLEFFDEKLLNAIKLFQKNHGLKDDGIVGKKTLSKLNTPIGEKIQTIRINLERMRWMPRTLGKEYLLVNIPEFNLRVYEDNNIKLNMPIIVGEQKFPTPIFSHKISTVVLNPYWRIPQSIVKKEIIPKVIEDPYYLEKENIKTFENWDHESTIYDNSTIDWQLFLEHDLVGTEDEAPMRFIQVPGDKNPLGRIKFLFPNRYSVYLHDTPNKSLFEHNIRAFSHGCIRVSIPKELLEHIVQKEGINTNETDESLKNLKKTDIDLNKKIPVHIVYLTSWIDEEGRLQFRDDIYNFDKLQMKYLGPKKL